MERAHRTALVPLVALALLFGLVALALLPSLLSAAMITVTTTQDAIADSGACSLREAIIAANTNAPSGATEGECPSGNSGFPDTITLPAGQFNLSIPSGGEGVTSTTATVGDLDITQDLILTGQGATLTTIDASGLGARALHIKSTTAVVLLANLRIRGGSTAQNGGGIYFQDGDSLTVSSVTITGNGAQESGGGLWATNSADLVMTDVEISNNGAVWYGGGLFWGDCGGCSQTLHLRRVDFILNTLDGGAYSRGGGAYSGEGFLSLDEVNVQENHSESFGGGMEIGSTVQANRVSVVDNSADGYGGGIHFEYPSSGDFLNCTMSGNTAGSEGGGVHASGNFELVSFKHCTIANNTAPTGSAIVTGYDVALANSIIAGTCAGNFVDSLGGNIESPGDNCGLDQPTDRVSVTSGSLSLATLAWNGGRTQTHLLGASSIALESARTVYCLEEDQRGLARPQGAACDVGAVEGTWAFLFVDDFESSDLSAWSSRTP